MSYSDHFRGIATCTVGDGKTVMLWYDIWNKYNLHQQLPRLYSYAKNAKISLATYMDSPAIEENFHLPLSPEAFNELQTLNQILNQQQLQQQKDQRHYIWGSPTYSTRKFYMIPFIALRPP